MYSNHNIAVVIPIHNEEAFIEETLRSVPDFVDQIIVIDDGSRDKTIEAIERTNHPKVHLIKHRVNSGVGAATISGYQAALSYGVDIIAVMDGDGQMNPADLPALLEAIIAQKADYVKGNRFLHSSIKIMPLSRFLGNFIFSNLMKLALGLRESLDAQCGYTAIRSNALRQIDFSALYPRYGFLNSLLFSLADANLKICSVPVCTIYGEEISGINPYVTIPTILLLIFRGYLKRIYRSIRANTDLTPELGESRKKKLPL